MASFAEDNRLPTEIISVCVVENDDASRRDLVTALVGEGFIVRGFPGSRELYLGLLQESCDVVILDAQLPGEDGFTVMEKLRSATSLGIIMQTTLDHVAERIRVLHGGADACLLKPVSMDELAATTLSVSRRMRLANEQKQERHNGWRLLDGSWLLISPKGDRVTLSMADRTLLGVLFRKPAAVVPRSVLAEALGHHADEIVSNRLDMSISRLRRKVMESTGLSLPLRSVRGFGFSFHPDEREFPTGGVRGALKTRELNDEKAPA